MNFFTLSFIYDFFLILIIVYFIFRGTRKGALSYFYSLLALVGAYPLACSLFNFILSFFPQEVAQRMQGDAIAFATVLLLLYLLIVALCWGLLGAFNRFIVDFPDKLAGAILGFIKGLAITTVVILLSLAFTPTKLSLFKDSYLTRFASFTVEHISRPLPRHLREKFMHKRKELELQWEKTPLHSHPF